MRIIERGPKPIEWLEKCKHCKSVFAYVDSERRHIGYPYYGSCIKCPVCKVTSRITEPQIPANPNSVDDSLTPA